MYCHNTEARQRSYTAFLHLGKHVCRRMFCLLHAISTGGSLTSRPTYWKKGSPVMSTVTPDDCQLMRCPLTIDRTSSSTSGTTPRSMPFCFPGVYYVTSVTMGSCFLRQPRSARSGRGGLSTFVHWLLRAHSDVCSILSGLEAFPPEDAHHKASKRPLLGVLEEHRHHACCQSARGEIHCKHDNCSKYERQRKDTHHTLHVHVLSGLDTEDYRCTCTLVRLDT